MSSATENGRIDLQDNFQFKMFDAAMKTLREFRDDLSDYERRVFDSLDDGFNLAGRDMKPTRKQFNFIRQVAFDLRK